MPKNEHEINWGFEPGVLKVWGKHLDILKETRMSKENINNNGNAQVPVVVPIFGGEEKPRFGLTFAKDPVEVRRDEILADMKDANDNPLTPDELKKKAQEDADKFPPATRSGNARLVNTVANQNTVATMDAMVSEASEQQSQMATQQAANDTLPRTSKSDTANQPQKGGSGFGGFVRKVFGVPEDNSRHLRVDEAARAVALGVAAGVGGADQINNAQPVVLPNEGQSEVTQVATLQQPGSIDLTEKPTEPWVAKPSSTPPAEVTPNPNLDPTAKALISLTQEQRNVVLTDSENVKFDESLEQVTLEKDGINYRFDPNKAVEGNPEMGLVVMNGSAVSADGTTTIFVDNMWNTRLGEESDTFETLEINDQGGLQAIADMYASVSAQEGKTGEKIVRLVVSKENIGTPGNVAEGWDVLFTMSDNTIGGAVYKGEVGNQKEIKVYIDISKQREEDKAGWIYSRVAGAALEDASRAAFDKFDSNGVQGGDTYRKFKVFDFWKTTFAPSKKTK